MTTFLECQMIEQIHQPVKICMWLFTTFYMFYTLSRNNRQRIACLRNIHHNGPMQLNAWMLMQEFPQRLQCGLRDGALLTRMATASAPGRSYNPLAVTKPHQTRIRYKDGWHTVGLLRDTRPACEESSTLSLCVF